MITSLYPAEDETALEKLSEDIGLFRIQEKLYQQYLEQRERELELQRKVKRLADIHDNSTIPVVYVEGKNDVQILKTAWAKLYTNNMPFDIKSCDPLAEDSDGGAAGVDTLASFLKTVRADSPHFAIGIFDRDSKGTNIYNSLPRYFVEVESLDAKISKNHKAAAFLLPVPAHKQQYVDCYNFCIEFYFSDAALERRTNDDRGLGFRQPEIEKRVRSDGGPIIEVSLSDLPHTRQIVSGKTIFANNIVPSLHSDEFDLFTLVFEKIHAILSYLRGQ